MGEFDEIMLAVQMKLLIQEHSKWLLSEKEWEELIANDEARPVLREDL